MLWGNIVKLACYLDVVFCLIAYTYSIQAFISAVAFVGSYVFVEIWVLFLFYHGNIGSNTGKGSEIRFLAGFTGFYTLVYLTYLYEENTDTVFMTVEEVMINESRSQNAKNTQIGAAIFRWIRLILGDLP